MAFGDKRGTGKYVKVEPTAELAVVGDEVLGHASWDADKRRFVHDAQGSLRFGVQVWCADTLGLLQGGWRLYRALTDAVGKDGPDSMYRVTKSGDGVNTQYQVELVRALTSEEKDQIAAAKRYDMDEEFPWADGAFGGAGPPAGDDEVPF